MAYGFGDNKRKVSVESLTLLKDYGNITTFTARDEYISGLSNYDFIDVEVKGGAVYRFSVAADHLMDISAAGLIAIDVESPDFGTVYLTARYCEADSSNNTITFGDCYCKLLTASQTTVTNDYLVPRKIYGVKI